MQSDHEVARSEPAESDTTAFTSARAHNTDTEAREWEKHKIPAPRLRPHTASSHQSNHAPRGMQRRDDTTPEGVEGGPRRMEVKTMVDGVWEKGRWLLKFGSRLRVEELYRLRELAEGKSQCANQTLVEQSSIPS